MSAAEARHTRGLDELRATDADRFGGKSASLGELLHGGIPVPPGFAISADAGEELTDASRHDIATRYAGLGDDVPVAVRSSAVGEDSAEATFAGQQDTYLWVRGLDAVCDAVQRCWASLYNPEAVAYRERFKVENPAMGVTIQLMVDAAVSGVMFTCNPVSGDRSTIAINASWGLGLAVVGGEVTPDDYLVSKVTGEVLRETISDKASTGRTPTGRSGWRSTRTAAGSRALMPPASRPSWRSPSVWRSTSAAPRTSSGRSTARTNCSSSSPVRSPAWPNPRPPPHPPPRCP
jgi:pyruvate, water dikinase